MSSSDHVRPSSQGAREPTAEEIAAARQRLADLDASVFSGAVAVSPIQHNDLIRRAVRKLFGHGR